MTDQEPTALACDAIVNGYKSILASKAFVTWQASNAVQVGDIVVCNNSFLFREARSTTKSNLYLGFEASEGAKFHALPIVVTTTKGINLQFKRLSAAERTTYPVTSLETAVREQWPHLGSIIFSIAGRIGDAEAAEVALSGTTGIHTLRYQPGQSALVHLSDGVISLGRLADLNAIWAELTESLADSDIDTDALGEAVEAAFPRLQETVTRAVDPNEVTEDGPSILQSVLDRMSRQADEFSATLRAHREQPDDTDTYNELLRIAYIFADGARSFLDLVVGICDLKPLVFWLTAFEQIDLADRFARLPFALVGKGKPSLAKYRSVIADARNQAFHDLFAFDHPFTVRLGGDAFRTPELRLFREFNKRNDPALSFEDRALVDLLQALTRTTSRPVPEGFWEANEQVMQGVVEVVHSLRRALVVVSA